MNEKVNVRTLSTRKHYQSRLRRNNDKWTARRTESQCLKTSGLIVRLILSVKDFGRWHREVLQATRPK